MASRKNKRRGSQSNNVLYIGDDELDHLMPWDDLPVDVETEGKLIELVRKLQAVAPHIRWRIRWNEHDLGNYLTLAVPSSQSKEAEFIIGLWERGENLKGYCTEWMYPEIYAVVDGKAVLRQEIATFISLANELTRLLWEGAQYDLQELMLRLLRLLPQLYVAGWNLPVEALAHATEAYEYELEAQVEHEVNRFCRENLPKHWPDFGTFETYYGTDIPYGSTDGPEKAITVEKRNLSKDFWELFHVLNWGLEFFNKKGLEGKLSAVGYWRFEFGWTFGYKILQILAALHQALEIEQRERRIRKE